MTGRPAAPALLLAGSLLGAPATGQTGRDGVGPMLDAVRREAAAAGVSAATVADALAGFTPDPKVLALLGRQAEFSRPIGEYVSGAVSPARVRQGRALAVRWDSALAAAEERTGVPRAIVLAIWAQESAFGAATGGFSTIRSLGTLALSGTRRDYFRGELVAALRILEEEHAPPGRLTGSWAGAMGQTQFMPSSFLRHAADGDDDGRRDIWSSTPDVIASIAGFLAAEGWRRDRPWGWAVSLPADLDLSSHDRPLAEWAARGVRPASGGALPGGDGRGRLFLPAGIEGPAFLLSENWDVLRAYNTSDAYALGIGVLADAIDGAPGPARPWPRAPVLSAPERVEVHRRLAALGVYAGTPDGKFGAATRDAVRRVQAARGLRPDGYADPAFLSALRAEAVPRAVR